MKQLCQTETDPGVILICKLQDICSTERQKDKICLKSHVSNGQPLKSPASENRLYFIDHKSVKKAAKYSKMANFYVFHTVNIQLLMGQSYMKRQSSAQTLQNSAIASVNVLAVYSDLCLQTWELGAGGRQRLRFLQTKWKFPECSVW